MECSDVLESTVLRLSGELTVRAERALEAHMEACPACRAEAERLASAWDTLGADPDAVVSDRFREETLELLEEETARKLRERVKPFPSRRVLPLAAQIAAVLVAAVGGYFAARLNRPAPAPPSDVAATNVSFPVSGQRTVDVSKLVPDLSRRPRLANVAYKEADPNGKIQVSFDVTTRYTLVGKPEEKGIADVLAYIVSGAAETEGAKGKAIDLVSQHYGDGATPSPQILSVLTETLKNDKNPGVRKKAAEALVQLPPTKETQLALMGALKTDTNPAIRILAVEGLAKAARELKDPETIQTLREKASDEGENGYVRNQAALALKNLQL